MFNLLMRVFHDGIIILDNNNIVYSNKQIFKILALDEGDPNE